jgi:hypothetical protein
VISPRDENPYPSSTAKLITPLNIPKNVFLKENAFYSEKSFTKNSRIEAVCIMRLCCRLPVGTIQHVAYTIIFIYFLVQTS